jgi:hypothetical protein
MKATVVLSHRFPLSTVNVVLLSQPDNYLYRSVGLRKRKTEPDAKDIFP